MIYINIHTGQVLEDINWSATDLNPADWSDRHDWTTFARAEAAAEHAGEDYIAVDKGAGVYPRFDVIRKPQVGDQVSYAFNGDSYPDGEIKSISPSLKVIVTTTGHKFYRNKQSGNWKMEGTWSLIRGHISKQNPHF